MNMDAANISQSQPKTQPQRDFQKQKQMEQNTGKLSAEQQLDLSRANSVRNQQKLVSHGSDNVAAQEKVRNPVS